MASIVGSGVPSVWSNQDLREVLISYCAALALVAVRVDVPVEGFGAAPSECPGVSAEG
jgi:hypothetical protein